MLKALIKHYRTRHRPLRLAQLKARFARTPSLTQGRLPWVDYDPIHRCFLLEDARSVGVAFECEALACEAKPQAQLEAIRDKFQRLFQDTLPQELDNPWVLQCYCFDELGLENEINTLRDYVKPFAKNTAQSAHYEGLFVQHCDYLTQPQGLFTDTEVTGTVFRGKHRRIRLVLYRHIPAKSKQSGAQVLRRMNSVAKTLTHQLNSCGIRLKRMDGQAFYEWLVRWFNPAPKAYQGDVNRLLAQCPYPGDEARPFGYDFAEQCFYAPPRSSQEKGLWYFDEQPHQFITVQALSQVPDIGHISGEREQGGKSVAFFDQLPEGSIFMMTVVIEHQEKMRNHLAYIEHSCVGNHVQTRATRDECQKAREAMVQGNALFPAVFGVYLRAKDETALMDKRMDVEMRLGNAGLKPLHEAVELFPLDSYLRYLPMAYNPAFDKRYTKRSRLVFARQLANLLPLYGRYRGTGRPGISFWNRTGEPLNFDPFHKADKSFNSHLLFLGATGAGKSASLVSILMQVMAIYRPRLFIIEAGQSFQLLCEHLKEQGLSVNQVTLSASAPTALNPFANALKLIAPASTDAVAQQLEETLQDLDKTAHIDEESRDPSRDYLGEMTLMCQLMITGGEAKEEAKISRQDRQVIIEALLMAATEAGKNNVPEVIAEDIVGAFKRLSAQYVVDGDADKAKRTREMADGMQLFCSNPLYAAFFNRPGHPWPLNDVTRLDMGLMKDEGYEAPLALAFMSIMTRILALSEHAQSDERMTLVLIDESHIITQNPLAAAVITKVSKMSRKLGLWLWFATQNIADFPDASRKMLTMLEFWLCLGTSEDELDQIERFKPISVEERALFKSVRKSIPNYVEGVILSPKVKGLFRNIPPRLALALGMTEKDEKAQRKRLMKRYGISEVQAAAKVAEELMGIAAKNAEVDS